MKTCSKCREQLPLDRFHRATKGSQGRAAYCKTCQRERTKAWREKRKVEGVVPPASKYCPSCKTTQPASQFHKQSCGGGGLQSKCKQCQRETNDAWRRENTQKYQESNRAWNKANSKKKRDQYYKNTYGISLETYEGLRSQHGSQCAICQRNTQKLNLDHNHETGELRGFLCNPCNRGLGLFQDNSDTLRAAAAYLDREALSSGKI